MPDIPTKEEFERKSIRPPAVVKKWSAPIYLCPVCAGGMRKNLVDTYLSNPVKYLYKCDTCDHEEYQCV